MQGYKKLFLVHMPMFNMADHRWQLIITADIPYAVMGQYRRLHEENPNKFYTIANTTPDFLEKLLKLKTFPARMDDGIPTDGTPPLAEFEVSNVKVIVNEALSFENLQTTYPEKMPFYLYGSGDEYHIDHVLKTSPNAQLNSDRISLVTKQALTEKQINHGVVAVLNNVYESSMQPL